MSTAKQDPSRQQADASNPEGSAWVSANAGSGKTHVLVNRVVRLLLNGTAPERILCLTYTKAAAAEMSSRLFDELAGWIALDDNELIGRIHNHTGHAKFRAEDHAIARRLFTRALETPGGLKVQTIHAFCERLLQRFPVEAGVVPGFEVMDDDAARQLRRQARSKVLSAARSGSDDVTLQHLAVLAGFASHDQFDDLIKQLIDKRRVIAPIVASTGGLDAAAARLHEVLGTKAGETAAGTVKTCLQSLDRQGFRRACEVLAARDSKTDKAQAALIVQLLETRMDDQAFATLKSLFLTKAEQPKADSSVLTEKAAGAHSGIARFLFAARDQLMAVMAHLKALRIHAATMALLHIGAGILKAYEADKRHAGLYDYDDLILKTLNLLTAGATSQWVLYKLDGGLDHILIDEAQDTSPEQWQIIERLSEEFFSGHGAREDTERTIFAVGDRKQSIYSFQGADPSEFERMRRHFQSQAANAGQSLSEVPLQVSFRSTPQVLQAVDMVFSQPRAVAGLTVQGASAEVHAATRSGQAGLVELWPLEQPDGKEHASPWRAPTSEQAGDHPRLKLAAKIADTISNWIAGKQTLTPHGRPVRYGDVLILVRNRTTFTDAMVRALKVRGIPVAGADRLKLTRHIAVQDLLSLARFVLLPSDDLSLAEVLKSPLVARDDGRPLDDGDLFGLAYGRSRMSLWQRLSNAVGNGAPYGAAFDALDGWRGRAGFETPYDFFSRILAGDGRRKAMLARLGSEAAEPLDAFIAEALNYEQRHSPDLVGFVAWLEGVDLEIKRDMDHSGNEVRVMTVHGAKGLEANIVILPDTDNVPDAKKVPAILFNEDDPAGAVPLWRLRAPDAVASTESLQVAYKQAMLEEENRLLYVAMTRARDRLYICGYANHQGKVSDNSWYDLTASALKRDEYAVFANDGEITCWRIEGKQTEDAHERDGNDAATVRPDKPPGWALTQPPAEDAALNWFVASRLAGTGHAPEELPSEQLSSPLEGDDQERFRRGNLIHRLLQLLPELPQHQWAEAARRYLLQPANGLTSQQAESTAAEVLAVMQNPEFAAVFGPGSRAEVALTARLMTAGGPTGLTGQIDRLAVSGDDVLIVDYKTNRPPPACIDDADPAYIRQLAAYRAALAAIYPDKHIRAALLWTNTATFMEVPEALMERAVPASGVIT